MLWPLLLAAMPKATRSSASRCTGIDVLEITLVDVVLLLATLALCSLVFVLTRVALDALGSLLDEIHGVWVGYIEL